MVGTLVKVAGVAAVGLACACSGGGGAAPSPTKQPPATLTIPAPFAPITTEPRPSPVPTYPPPLRATDDASAFEIAFGTLFASSPPYSTSAVTGARFVRTHAHVADLIRHYRQPSESYLPVWLFVFTGRFQHGNRFHPERAVVTYTAFVVVRKGEGPFGSMSISAESYDLTPAGLAITVPPEIVQEHFDYERCVQTNRRTERPPCASPGRLTNSVPVAGWTGARPCIMCTAMKHRTPGSPSSIANGAADVLWADPYSQRSVHAPCTSSQHGTLYSCEQPRIQQAVVLYEVPR